MSDLTSLIDAATRGDIDRVRALIDHNPALVHQRDEFGATPLHFATLSGHRHIAHLLLDRGADINSADGQYGATPSGWAIEYLRERGGYLAIELDDLAYAIAHGDARWVARFLKRFPGLRRMRDKQGTPFAQLASESGNSEIEVLFREVHDA
jgi:ankyrin repeat protein